MRWADDSERADDSRHCWLTICCQITQFNVSSILISMASHASMSEDPTPLYVRWQPDLNQIANGKNLEQTKPSSCCQLEFRPRIGALNFAEGAWHLYSVVGRSRQRVDKEVLLELLREDALSGNWQRNADLRWNGVLNACCVNFVLVMASSGWCYSIGCQAAYCHVTM